MATGAVLTPKRIASSELDAVLEQARVEGWRELAIFGPQGDKLRRHGVPEAHTFYLREPLGTRISKLTTLTGLTTLDLSYNQIGEEGGRALATLTGLTTLDLSGNQLGDEGARALAALTGLTTLDLSGNQLGDEGARALAALAQLTTLDLRQNQLRAEGARTSTKPSQRLTKPILWIR